MADSTVLYLTPDINGGHPTDSMTVIEGRFNYEATVDTVRIHKLYAPSEPDAAVIFFTEPGNVHIELSRQAGHSRVSGTKVNNEWQALNDTVAKYDHQLRTLFEASNDSVNPRRLTAQVQRLYIQLTQRITEAARRNSDNALGHFISRHFTDGRSPSFHFVD